MGEIDITYQDLPALTVDDVFANDDDPGADFNNGGLGEQRVALGTNRDAGVISRLRREDDGEIWYGIRDYLDFINFWSRTIPQFSRLGRVDFRGGPFFGLQCVAMGIDIRH